MTDLRTRLASALDDVRAPDLLPEIKRRGPRIPPPDARPTARRIVTAAVALSLAVVAFAFLMRAFEPATDRMPLDDVTSPPGQAIAATPGASFTGLAQGVGVTWPENWTLVQLAGEVNGNWPAFQLGLVLFRRSAVNWASGRVGEGI